MTTMKPLLILLFALAGIVPALADTQNSWFTPDSEKGLR